MLVYLRLWCFCVLLVQGAVSAQLNVTRTVSGTEVFAVRVQGCEYVVPWISPVLLLNAGCKVYLPGCRALSRIRFVVESVSLYEPLWTLRWDNVSFTAVRLEDGLWLQMGEAVFVMQAVPTLQFVTVDLEFGLRNITVRHSLDPYGPLVVPWPNPDFGWSECVVGPMESVALHSIMLDSRTLWRGWDLDALVEDPRKCVYEGRELAYTSERWTLHPSLEIATLELKESDLVRCLETGQTFRFGSDVLGVSYLAEDGTLLA